MAYAASPVASTEETTNYARLCRLLVNIGTKALRDTFDAIHAPANLHAVLASNKGTLKHLRIKKIINPIQWGKLFPAIPTAVSSNHFDTTLLMVLLRNICGLIPPSTGWDKLPAATDLSREADLVRIKHYRNTIYGHAEKASVDDTTFNDCWRDIRDTLVRLGGVTYAVAVDTLKDECMDPQVQNHYKELLSHWKKDEDNVKEQFHEIMKNLAVLSTAKEKTGGPLASINPSMCKESYHENKALEFYCQDCSVCICLKCGQTRHNQHSKVEIQRAAEEKKEQRKKIVDRAKADVDSLEAKMKEQGRLMNESEKEVAAAQNKVTETVEEIIRRLREYEAEIKTQLTKINETQKREHATCSANLQLCVKDLKASMKYDEGVLQKSDCLEILQADNAAFSLREENLTIQEIELYRPRHVNYVLNQGTLNVSRPLVLGKVVASHTDASKSIAEGQGLKEAELGVETNFKVTTRDSQRNQFYDEEDQVIVKIYSASREHEEKDMIDMKDGSYIVRYKPKRLGLHYVRIEVNGQPLTDSPWSFKVNPHGYKFAEALSPGTPGPSTFTSPWSIALNERTRQIAIADYDNKCIQIFDHNRNKGSRWTHLKTIGSRRQSRYRRNTFDIGHPMSVAFLRNNDLIFTHKRDANTDSEQMLVYSAHDQSNRIFSKHVFQPLSVFVKTEGDGQVVVCDAGNKTIKVLSPDGRDLLQSFSPPECNESPGFVFHKNGTFYASYPRLHCIKVFNDEGVFQYDIGSFGSGDGQLNRPIGLAVDSFNQLIVCDNGNLRLQVFTLKGKFLYSIKRDPLKVSFCVLEPLFVAVSNGNEIMICDVAKEFTGRILVFK